MNTKQTADFIKRRVRKLILEARAHPLTAMVAYAYFERARAWALRNGYADLAALAGDAKYDVLGVAA